MHFLSNPTLCTWCRMYLPMCQETFGVWREIAFAWIHKWGPLDRDEVGQKKILEGPLDELPYTNAVMRGEPMKCLLVNFLFGSLGKSCWAKKQKLWQKCLSSPSENSSIYLINCMRMNIVVVVVVISRYFGIHFNTFLENVGMWFVNTSSDDLCTNKYLGRSIPIPSSYVIVSYLQPISYGLNNYKSNCNNYWVKKHSTKLNGSSRGKLDRNSQVK